MRGTFSGGTIASLLNVLDECRRDPKVRQIVNDAYALNPVVPVLSGESRYEALEIQPPVVLPDSR
jgi:hypothetical protein